MTSLDAVHAIIVCFPLSQVSVQLRKCHCLAISVATPLSTPETASLRTSPFALVKPAHH
ncbi:hypothetical protein Micbo1qcDRAFT_168708, partial [Microdochium bolleyi]